jgi:hypothetical protein
VYLQREVASAVASTKVPHRCKLQGEMTARQIVLDCDLMLTKRRKNVSSPNTNVSKPHTKRFKVQYTRFKSQYKRFTIVKIMRGDNDLELFFKICQINTALHTLPGPRGVAIWSPMPEECIGGGVLRASRADFSAKWRWRALTSFVDGYGRYWRAGRYHEA